MFPRKPRPQKLRNLQIEEISLVDRNANQQTMPDGTRVHRSNVVLLKRDNPQNQYLDRKELLAHMDQVEQFRRKQTDDRGSQSVKTGEEKKVSLKRILKSDNRSPVNN